MPDFHTWISFVAATEALLIIPGPTVLLVISYALAQGKRSAWATVPGVAAGDFTAMALSLLGLGAVLAASAELFTVLKLAGAAYLVYLGIKLWRAPIAEGGEIAAPAAISREPPVRLTQRCTAALRMKRFAAEASSA